MKYLEKTHGKLAVSRLTIWAVLLWSTSACVAHGQASFTAEASDYDRTETPVSQALPVDFSDKSKAINLLDEKSGKHIPAQIDDGSPRRLWWLESALAGERRSYQIVSVDTAEAPVMNVTDDGDTLVISNRGRPVLSYQHQTMPSPVADKPFHARSGFISSVKTPGGKQLIDPMPTDHLHQHGVMFAWRQTEFEGRSVNFWEDAAQQGKVIHSKIIGHNSGPVFGEFTVSLKHIDTTAPGGDKEVLAENWRVRAYATSRDFVWDLDSTQTASSSSPLHMNQFHYGGFMIRGSAEWIDGPHEILTSHGDGRLDGNHTRPLWVDMHGVVAGQHVGLTTMGHPSNFRFPQSVRLHPTMPYYCFAPMVDGEFDIAAGKPHTSRFRFVAHDGPLDRRRAVAYWREWSDSQQE